MPSDLDIITFSGRTGSALSLSVSETCALHVQSLCAQGSATTTSNPWPLPIPPGKERIPDLTPPHHETQQGRRKVSDPQDPVTDPPKTETSPSPPLYVPRLHPVYLETSIFAIEPLSHLQYGEGVHQSHPTVPYRGLFETSI